ncbi:MAG: hypothetical protein VW935_19260, partial [Novosphingobium sp.]
MTEESATGPDQSLPGTDTPDMRPLLDMPNLSPEARRQEAVLWRQGVVEARQRLGPGSKFWE